MDFLPVNLNTRGKICCVVGGGAVALRKSELLARAGAVLHVIALQVDEDLKDLVASTGGKTEEKEFYTEFAEDSFLVVVATDDTRLNKQISAWAHSAGKPVNVVDQPDLCSFIFPAIIDRSPVIASVSSSGASPVMARLLRARLEAFLPGRLGELAGFLADRRTVVKQAFGSINERKNFWEEVLWGAVAEEVLAGKTDVAASMFDELLREASEPTSQLGKTGEVYLIGAGPGDPDLLTFRALRLLQQSDVVLYDRLVSDPIVDLARRDAEKVYVGKARDNHVVPQEDINELLVRYAREGKRVCRLKGGDPFIFGRGGEEISRVAELGISFQVVPGITAASGCASYAGIPLTHRDYSQSVRFVTGHLKDGEIELDWQNLVNEKQTLVFYMGLVSIRQIANKLVANGMKEDMPVAIVEKGTTAEQRVLVSTISSIADDVEKQDIKAPTIIIVGHVVSLHGKLNWYRGVDVLES